MERATVIDMALKDIIGVTVVTRIAPPCATLSDLGMPKHYEGMGFVQAQPATWEGSVLPALRAVMSRMSMLRGATVKNDGPVPGALVVTLEGQGWWVTEQVRTDTAEHVEHDARLLCVQACGRVADLRVEQANVPPCPVCQAMPGWVCSTCREPADCSRCGLGPHDPAGCDGFGPRARESTKAAKSAGLIRAAVLAVPGVRSCTTHIDDGELIVEPMGDWTMAAVGRAIAQVAPAGCRWRVRPRVPDQRERLTAAAS